MHCTLRCISVHAWSDLFWKCTVDCLKCKIIKTEVSPHMARIFVLITISRWHRLRIGIINYFTHTTRNYLNLFLSHLNSELKIAHNAYIDWLQLYLWNTTNRTERTSIRFYCKCHGISRASNVVGTKWQKRLPSDLQPFGIINNWSWIANQVQWCFWKNREKELCQQLGKKGFLTCSSKRKRW